MKLVPLSHLNFLLAHNGQGKETFNNREPAQFLNYEEYTLQRVYSHPPDHLGIYRPHRLLHIFLFSHLLPFNPLHMFWLLHRTPPSFRWRQNSARTLFLLLHPRLHLPFHYYKRYHQHHSRSHHRSHPRSSIHTMAVCRAGQ
jgi:hypothetical protein